MKILILAPEQNPVPPIVGGSVENCIYQISKKLAHKHKITILSRRHNKYSTTTKSGNLSIIRVPEGKPFIYLASALSRIKNQHFDIIQIDNRPKYVPMVRKCFPDTAISVFLHSLTFVTPPMTSRRRAEANLSQANLIVGNSRSLEQKLISMFPIYQNQIKHVHLGVNIRQFKPPSPKQKQRIRKKYNLAKSFSIVFAGRLIPRKGIPVLIKATKEARKSIPSAKLVIAGSTGKSVYKRHLKKLASYHKVPVKFMGYVPRSKMHEVYSMGDCFVCPSQKHEAFGLVIVEALASGLPCIASDIGGIPEIINHRKNGILVKRYKDPSAFSKQIVNIAKDKTLARELSSQGRKDAVNQFNWGVTANRLETIYAEQIKNSMARGMVMEVNE